MAAFQPLNAYAMKNRLVTKGLKGNPTLAWGGVHVGQALLPAQSPSTTNPITSTSFTSTRAFWVRRDRVRFSAWITVIATMEAAATPSTEGSGTRVPAKLAAATALMAMGAENPSSSVAQPA